MERGRMGGGFDQNIVYACMKFSNKKKSKNCVSSIVNYLNQKYVRNKGHIIKKKKSLGRTVPLGPNGPPETRKVSGQLGKGTNWPCPGEVQCSGG